MPELKVTFEDLYEASSMLSREAAEIESRLASMRGQLSPIHASWSGGAKSEFDRLWDEWDANARALNGNLEDIARILNAAGQNYEQAEQSNRQAMGG